MTSSKEDDKKSDDKPADDGKKKKGFGLSKLMGGGGSSTEQKSAETTGSQARSRSRHRAQCEGRIESGDGHGEGDPGRGRFVQERRKAELNADVGGLLSSLSAQVLAGLVLLGLAAGVRLITTNRVVRSRVRLTIALSLIFIGINAALASPALLQADSRALAVSVSQLLFAFALIQFLVLVLVNPLRADRVPERFPTIIQDVAVFTLFAMVATLVLQEKFLTTSAVGAVVAGLALQDTLGNLVSGLAIQVEKPFRLGHWIRLAEWEGEVSEITWRAVKVRTRDGNEVIIPNGELAKSALVNYSEPASPTRIYVEVGASYEDAPNTVRDVMLRGHAARAAGAEGPGASRAPRRVRGLVGELPRVLLDRAPAAG